jgi:hypothetical protein
MMKCPFFAGGYYKVIEGSDKRELGKKGIKETLKKRKPEEIKAKNRPKGKRG